MRKQENPGWFVTLTYDEKHVKRVGGGRLSLRFRDVQLYMKKIRKDGYYMKYVCVGEYGAETERPHYHLLMWTDCPVERLQDYWTSSKDGSPMGHIHVGQMSVRAAMYAMKYILQPKKKYAEDQEKPRAQFSKGLGLGYLTAAVCEYHNPDRGTPVLVVLLDGKKVALPRYYRNKIFTKYQMSKEASKMKWNAIRAYRKEMRVLLAQGITNTKSYMKAIRVEQNRRMFEKNKYGLTL